MNIDTARRCPPAPGCPYFAPTEITVTAGTIVFYLDNPSGAPHNFLFGPDLDSPLVGSPKIFAGYKRLFTVENVPAGSYVFWCNIDNGYGPHFERGMVGTLTIEE